MQLVEKGKTYLNMFIALCVVVAAFIFIVDLTIPLSDHTRHIMHEIDFMLLSIFAIHMVYSFFTTFDKRKFFAENWLLILSLLPLAGPLRIAKLRKPMELFRLFKHRHELHSLGIKQVSEKTRMIDDHVEIFKKSLPLNNANWGVIQGKKVILNLYISPSADKEVVKGLIRGFTDFLKTKVNTKPIIIKRNWFPVFRIEQHSFEKHGEILSQEFLKLASTHMKRHDLNIFITEEEVELSGALTDFSDFRKSDKQSYYLFTTKGLADYSDKYPYEIDLQKEHRGYIIGYYTLVKRYEYNFLKRKCADPHCIHRKVDKTNLDKLSFMYFMNRRKPICDVHMA